MDQPTMKVASAPVSFGVDEILVDDAWMPEPDQMLQEPRMKKWRFRFDARRRR